ncbi:MAG TPA: ribosome maturation factor RimM [Steroidobacteraceae bacterium]|nr:ribosome maturation factor RimM [Steroidobacteraceae bacterium]
MPSPENWIELGRVLGAFGIRGWIRIQSYTEPPEGILEYPTWHLANAGGRRLVRVEEARPHGRLFVARLAGCDDRDAAERLARDTIEVPRSELAKLGEREHYRADLIGMEVRSNGGERLGKVAYFMDTAGYAVMVVEGEQQHLIPATAAFLRRVDRKERTVWVNWQEPEGEQEGPSGV